MLSRFKIFQTKNAQGVLSMLAGNTISKGIFAVGGILISNLYGPDNFGLYNVFNSYVSILSIIGTLRLENILVTSKDSKEIKNFFNFLLWLSLFATFFFLLISIGFNYFNGKESQNIPWPVLLFSGIGSVVTAWNTIQNTLFTKYKLFKATSTGFVIMAFFSIVFQVGLYFIYPKSTGYYGLIIGSILGTVVSFFYYLYITRSRFQAFNWNQAKQTIKNNKEILTYTFPSESINALANNLFIILAAAHFSSKEIGSFALGSKILVTPLIMISSSLSRVYFQKVAQMFHVRKHHLFGVTLKVVVYNVLAIFVFLLLTNTLGLYLIKLFFNPEKWQGVDTYVFLLSFWILARSAVNPIANIVIVIKKNQLSLWMNIGLLLANFIAVYYGVSNNSFPVAVEVFSIVSGLVYLVFLMIILWELKKYKKLKPL